MLSQVTKIIFYLSAITVILLSGYIFFIHSPSANQQPLHQSSALFTESVNNYPQKNNEKIITLMMVGDIMTDRGVESSVQRNFNGDFSRLFDHLDILQEADLVLGNLEGPASDQGSNVGSKYSFRMDPIIIPLLAEKGFRVLSFANNHVGDYGQKAFEDTLVRLKQAGIQAVGAGINTADAREPRIETIHNTRIGFLGFTDVGPNWMQATENRAGILLAHDPDFDKIIQSAKEKVDLLIVSFHWGNEYVPFHSRQESLAQNAIDQGADIVVGHHPHVIQDIVWYKEKPIFYSLGNFIFDQYFSRETMQGMLAQITIQDKKIINIEPMIIELDRTYQPINIRSLESDDMVKKKVSVPELCPATTSWHKDKSLFPVNRQHGLEDYQPKNLTHMNNRIETRGTATCLESQTADATERMFRDMNAQGLKPVMTSGYRDYATQKIIYADWVAKQGGVLPEYPSVAEAGHSEHQLGTTIDIKSLQTVDFTYEAFGSSPEYAWLTKHAHTYGFVQSYTTGDETTTGYQPEPWHWRYVGTDIAKKVYASSLTLNEYLTQKWNESE